MKAKDIVVSVPTSIAKACIGRTLVGSVALEVLDSCKKYQAERKVRRLEDFMYGLSESVKGMEASLNEEYLRKDDFLDVFENAARKVVNERSEQKREMFRNVLCSSFFAESCSYDKTDKYLRILEELDELEIKILVLLRNPRRYNAQSGNVIKDPNEGSHMWISRDFRIMDSFESLLRCGKDDIYDALETLVRYRLVIPKVAEIQLRTNGHPIDIFNNVLTEKGQDFIGFAIR